MKRSLLLAAVALIACGPPVVEVDAGFDGGFDAGALPVDAGDEDAGWLDDAGFDAGFEERDAGAADAGELDAGPVDAGGDDAGEIDAGLETDAGADAGVPDAGTDAGTGFDAGSAIPGCAPPTGSDPPFVLRVMAANLTSGNGQSYDPGHGARIMQGAQPDIVAIQEFNYGNNSAAAIRGWVDSTFGTNFSYVRGNGQIPNGVISRHAFVSSGQWTDNSVSNRTFTWARIDIPGPHDLWVVSVHLLTSSAGNRNTEGTQLAGLLNANVPADDYVVIGGDFNTDTRSEAVFTALSSVVVNPSNPPVDQNGDQGTNSSRSKPYDQVLASRCIHGRQTATILGNSTYPHGLVVATRVHTPLRALSPALFGDSGAPNMQHMGVVRDFLIVP